MVEMRQPIAVKAAISLVMEHVEAMKDEKVSLADSYGRILAEDIVSEHAIPPFNRAPYDGFAIRAEDSIAASESNRITFNVVDHIGAGNVTTKVIKAGEAVRIMTGAAMPEGTDAVVMLEQARLSSLADTFTIRKPFLPLENVSLKGEDAKAGTALLKKGEQIHPGTIALLATLGYATVSVACKPRVGIIATGSELLDVAEELTAGKIRNSNGPMIEAQLARLRIPYCSYGKMNDDFKACLNIVKQACMETDCVITTGGVSVGDFDYLPAIYEKLGAKVLFNKVAMRPGSVTTVAILNGKLLFGLSGNPSACYTGFELFVRPALLRMMGSSKPYLRYTKAILQEDFAKPNPFTRFVRSIYQYAGEKATITPAGFNKSNAVTSIAFGNALMVLPGGTRGFSKGDSVDVLVLGTEDGDGEWII